MIASVLQTLALSPALEAQAHNDDQQRLLDAPETPEVDSVREAIATGDLQLALRLIDRLAASNAREREQERQFTGVIDRAVTDLRSAALNRGKRMGSGRVLARTLAPTLDRLGRTSCTVEAAICAGSIWRAIDGLTRDEVLRPAVTYQLGEQRTELLTRLLDWEDI